ncbi:MAG: hypothetical protein HJJLKODD_02348 [Phycisphaerae bacterium]|nr:hypothetical protein [Phycisphaerae bacterium]
MILCNQVYNYMQLGRVAQSRCSSTLDKAGAGWRMQLMNGGVLIPTAYRRLGLAVLVCAIGPTLASLLYLQAADSPAQVRWIYFLSKILLNLLPLLSWWWLERRQVTSSQRHIGIGSTVADINHVRTKTRGSLDMMVGLASGVGTGLVMWAVYLGLFRGSIDASTLREQVRAFGAYDYFLLYAVFLAVINSGLEEYYWRWFVFGRLQAILLHLWPRKRQRALIVAMVFSGTAFASHHYVVLNRYLQNSGLAAILSLGIAAGGMIWAYHYHRTGRIWGIWISHFLVDVTAFTIGYQLLFAGA